MDSLSEMQTVSRRYGREFEDDILTQAMFMDQLEKVFGSSAPNSFLGDITKGVERAAGQRGTTNLATEGIKAAIDMAKGQNEKNAIKSIRALLERDQ